MESLPSSRVTKPEIAPFIVGVGSSAGGIEALINLVSELPKAIMRLLLLLSIYLLLIKAK